MIGSEHGRAFGDAVTFQDFDGEFFFRDFAGFVAHTLRPANGNAQAFNPAIFAGAHILLQECIRRKKNRRAAFGDASGDGFCLQRGGVQHGRMAMNQRPERARRQPVTMKSRQGIKEYIRIFQRDMFFDLLNIGEDIGMGEDHAFGAAFRAGGK